ncbi:MAG: threonylcarbamoyl-AMP synthase [Chitinophagales bacterium]|nr:threonylcarbamoyl-AMP synthase [Chitinophagales bacterium]
MLIHIHPDNPQQRNIDTVVETLRAGGVIIYPTDTIYGIGCDITNPGAFQRICRIKGVDPKKAQFSFVCSDLSHISDYTKSIDTPTFRILKKALPGPYTFILNASKQVPKLMQTKKATVGIRVPDNNICRMIVEQLGNPILSTSLPMDEDVEYYTDPEVMYENFQNLVDIVIDAGPGSIRSSTVVDCTSGSPELIREGAGNWENLFS